MGVNLKRVYPFNRQILSSTFFRLSVVLFVMLYKVVLPQGVLAIMGYTGRLRPEGVAFFKLAVY